MIKQNKQKFLIAAFLIIFSTVNIFAQEKSDTVKALAAGDKAPEIKIAKFLKNAPKEKDNFKGKTLFLEFWATWCGPCKKMIPEINELVKKYKSDKVVFVSMTQEEEAKVNTFMKSTEMSAAIALDDKGLTNKNYGIKFIPFMVIINPNGIIDYAGHPGDISDEIIAEYLKTGKINIAPKDDDPEKNILYALNITKTSYPKEKPQYQFKSGAAQFINLSLKSILQMAYDATPMSLELDNSVANDNLDIYYNSGTQFDFEAFRDKFANELINALSLKYKKETVKRKIVKITCRDCSKLEKDYQQEMKTSKQLQSNIKESSSRFSADNVSVPMLVRTLETNYKIMFVDNTNLRGFYDFNVDLKNLKSAITDLENAGFKVEEIEDNVSIIKIMK